MLRFESLSLIQQSLGRLQRRVPQLPELYCSVQIFADGSGFVLDGRGEELASFLGDDDDERTIPEVINQIQPKKPE